MMAKRVSIYLFLFLIFALTVCSTGIKVGFYYDARKDTATSFLKLNKVSHSRIRILVADHKVLNSFFDTNVSVDLFLNKTQVEDLEKSNNSVLLELKTQLVNSISNVKIESVVLSYTTGEKGSNLLLLSTLKSIHLILESFDLQHEVKVSVTFPVSFLENLDQSRDRELFKIMDFLEKIKSNIFLETDIDGELSIGHRHVQSVIKKASSILRSHDVSMFLAVKNSVKQEHMIHSFHRELMNKMETKTVSHDVMVPPVTTYPTTPITNPPEISIPTVITVPSTNSPTNPLSTPVTVPGTQQPVTNPVTTYPSPIGNTPVTPTNPVTTPVTTPVTVTQPPAVANSPGTPGQTWCMAKTGASDTALQAALDYACGMGGAECSMIQPGASCYNPNTLQNHASYAFNSYYQKNPSPVSCNFGGTAMVVNTNPSSGSCIYPASSSSTLTSTPMPSSTPTTIPPSTPTPTIIPPSTSTPTIIPPLTQTPTPPSSSGASLPIYGSPPTMFNTTNPATATTSIFGSDNPPGVNSSMSMSSKLHPFVGCFLLATSLITGNLIL